MLRVLLFCLCFLVPFQAAALDQRSKDFIAANLIAIYYHEFGHALIDIMKLPIFGQEEDAADVLSVMLINRFFTGDEAVEIARATAKGFLGERSIAEAERSPTTYWGVHGPDLQRYYTFVCLFYGKDPDARTSLADELSLPNPRRRTCRREFEQASDAWGPVIEQLLEQGAGKTIRFLADHRTGGHGKLTTDVIEREVRAMNRDLSLPKRLLVRVEPCDTVNAFYSPKRREIIMCTEFAKYLHDVVPRR